MGQGTCRTDSSAPSTSSEKKLICLRSNSASSLSSGTHGISVTMPCACIRFPLKRLLRAAELHQLRVACGDDLILWLFASFHVHTLS